MAAQKGRNILIKVGNDDGPPETFDTLGGVRSRTMTINNEVVDITDSDSAGMREILDGGGIQSMSISGSGVFKDDTAVNTLEGYARANGLQTYQFVAAGLGTYEADFLCASFEYAGEHNGEASYACSFESSGAISFTPL